MSQSGAVGPCNLANQEQYDHGDKLHAHQLRRFAFCFVAWAIVAQPLQELHRAVQAQIRSQVILHSSSHWDVLKRWEEPSP